MKRLTLAKGLKLRGGMIHGPVYVNGVRTRTSYRIRADNAMSVEMWNEAVGRANARASDVKEGKFIARAAELERIAAGEPTLPTFAAFVEREYIPHLHKTVGVRKGKRGKHYVETIERAIATHLTPTLGELRIDQITRAHVSKSVDDITAHYAAEKKSPTTAAHQCRRLRAIMNYAIVLGRITVSPCQKVKVPDNAASPSAGARLKQPQVEHVLSLIERVEIRVLFAMGYMTLQRILSCIELQWKHVKYEDKTIEFHDTKNGVPLIAALVDPLRAYLDLLPNPGDPDAYVFEGLRAEHTVIGYNYPAIRKALLKACGAADIPYGRENFAITWHVATRASGATFLISSGVPHEHVRRMGGWKTLSAMQRYLGMDANERHAAASLLALKLPVATPPPARPRRGLTLVGGAR